MSRQDELVKRAHIIAKKTWGLQPPSAIEALTEMGEWADRSNTKFHTRMEPYIEMIERFKGCVALDSKRIHELEEQNVQLRARVDEYEKALEEIANYPSKDVTDFVMAYENLKSIARDALEKGRGK